MRRCSSRQWRSRHHNYTNRSSNIPSADPLRACILRASSRNSRTVATHHNKVRRQPLLDTHRSSSTHMLAKVNSISHNTNHSNISSLMPRKASNTCHLLSPSVSSHLHLRNLPATNNHSSNNINNNNHQATGRRVLIQSMTASPHQTATVHLSTSFPVAYLHNSSNIYSRQKSDGNLVHKLSPLNHPMTHTQHQPTLTSKEVCQQ